jgi:hypothetical protein
MYRRQPTVDNSGRRTVGVIAMTRLSVIVALAALAAGCSSASTGGHVTASPSGSRAHLTVPSALTVRCTETLSAADVTNGGVAGTGHCMLTGVLHDSGPTTDHRTQTAEAIFIRRVVTGAKGTITFVIKIPTDGAGGEPWTITSGTGGYAKLHGRGDQVVDNYTGTPATFVLIGTVSQA